MAIVVAIGHIRDIDRIAVAWLVIMIVVQGVLYLLGGHVPNHYLFKRLFMPQFGHLFIAGMMIYRAKTDRGSPTTILALGLAILYSLFGRYEEWAVIPPLIYFPINCVFVALVWAASSRRTFGPTILASIGVVSYLLYLLHVPIMLIVPHDTWKGIAMSLTVTLCMSVFSRYYVERPALTWSKSPRSDKLRASAGPTRDLQSQGQSRLNEFSSYSYEIVGTPSDILNAPSPYHRCLATEHFITNFFEENGIRTFGGRSNRSNEWITWNVRSGEFVRVA
jgi:peptidoglycan/LPS O-acetylase OafA/YrhL